jgi:SAM-dependent methyltransferase
MLFPLTSSELEFVQCVIRFGQARQQEMMMAANEEQVRLWNGTSAQAWVEAQPVLDRMFKPLTDVLIAELPQRWAGQVLDIGCGTGDTTLAIARVLGPGSRCVGVDISEPLIAAARDRAAHEGIAANYIRADAQTYGFEPASFDALVSRFGVMFFDDPLAAFANLRRAARRQAILRLIAWRGPAENPFMTTAERAAAPLLPDIPARQPDAPGQFAFADRERVGSLLEKGGWTDIDIQPVDVTCTLAEKELVRYIARFGPLGRALPGTDEDTRARIVETVRAAFDPYVHGAEVSFTAACWMVCGRA